MEVLIVLLILALLLGCVLGWVSFFKIKSLSSQVASLQRSVNKLIEGKEKDPDFIRQDSSARINVEKKAENVWTGPSSELPPADAEQDNTRPETISLPTNSLVSKIRDQWMIWLGGLSIGLSGIFMVRYSIDQGLLGPLARVLLGLIAGVILHVLAEWGRQRSRGNYHALAALAGGASIMLYAALLASWHLYALFPAGVVFFGLIAVSLATMGLAILHGPVLAILGILGAYVVPALVNTGSDNILGLFAYSLIITCAALMLMRYVYRPWLWSGTLAGSLGWWFLTIESYGALGLRGYYLAALLYLFLAVPHWDWRLRSSLAKDSAHNSPLSVFSLASLRKLFSWPSSLEAVPGNLSLGLMLTAFGLTIAAEQSLASAIFQWTPFVAILLIAAGGRAEYAKFVAFSLVIQMFAWLSLGLTSNAGIKIEGLIGPMQSEFLYYAAWMAFLYTVLSLRNVTLSQYRDFFCAMAVASPLLWLSLSYLLVTDLSESIVWGALAVALGVFYLALAAWRLRVNTSVANTAKKDEHFFVWLILAGHFAYSLAVAIMVREAGLTLALSAQIISIAWLIHRYNPPKLDWYLKLILATVVMRLTLNPWLLGYPEDIHWSLWTYGGATVFAAMGAWRLNNNQKLSRWLELAALHLLVLTLWAETRYLLYDGEIFSPEFTLVEFSINTALWSTLSLIYHLRQQVSENLRLIYNAASSVLLSMGLCSYLIVLGILNPFVSGEEISSTPLFNILLLSYGAPIIVATLIFLFHRPELREKIAIFIALATFIFINIEIRHLWSGELTPSSITSNGELYTYTIVWLALAIASLLAGSIRFGQNVYRAGFGLMMLVIGKIFLLDMADLEGLLRVASFMGLGLSLLGLAYLYQRFNLSPSSSKE